MSCSGSCITARNTETLPPAIVAAANASNVNERLFVGVVETLPTLTLLTYRTAPATNLVDKSVPTPVTVALDVLVVAEPSSDSNVG